MIDAVKLTLMDFDRYCPGFAGHTPELAGFVWFQGIADAGSPSFAADYGKSSAVSSRTCAASSVIPTSPSSSPPSANPARR